MTWLKVLLGWVCVGFVGAVLGLGVFSAGMLLLMNDSVRPRF
jgi:hypothetical protein